MDILIKIMKKLFSVTFVLTLALTLAACQTEKAPSLETNDSSMGAQSEIVETVGLGESCEENLCGSGFECNEKKICVETVVIKDLFCPETKAPVCGQKGDFKNGYLNECEARRHGATIVHEGFCKPDESVKGNCDAEITRIGYCDTLQTGVEYNGKKCISKTVTACDAEIPFITIGSCEKACKGFLKSVFK